jgi:HAD superfamily hydrolase (TIGR01509 family)
MNKSENPYDFAVIFDMDGVVVDSNPFHRRALVQFCQKHGYRLTEDQMKAKIFGRTNKEWLTDLLGGSITPNKIKEYEDEKESQFRKDYAPHVKPIKGLIRFLGALKRSNIKMALASSAPRLNVDFILRKTKTADCFEIIIDGDSIERGKPHPEIYLKTAKAIGFISKKCIVIEDSLSGVEAAKRAGCKVVGITTTHSPRELASTDLVINDFDEMDLKNLRGLF